MHGLVISLALVLAQALPLGELLDRDPNQKPQLILTTSSQKEAVRISVQFSLPAGMHQVLQQDYFGIDVTGLPAHWTLGPTKYPEERDHLLGLPSWSGTFTVQRDLIPPVGTPPAVPDGLTVTARWQICFDDGICLPPGSEVLGAKDSFPWVWALFLAFVGGLTLNLMPCVLPVLALKAIARPGWKSAVATAAGIEVGLLALGGVTLALQAAGGAVGWGFQFQSPVYGGVLALILVALALEWLGVWTLPSWTGWQRPASSFGSGLLTVALATPCTAPFLGTALGLTLAAPPSGVLAVFAVIGLGLGLPSLLVGVVPALARMIPRPGAWTVWVSRAGAVALLATAVWLGSVVFDQLRTESTRSSAPPPSGWQVFDPARVRAAAKDGPVVVEFTAAWCLTCRVNEAGVLSSSAFRDAVASSKAQLFWGDQTLPSAEIEAWLNEYGRAGVPFTLVLMPDKQPKILPELLSENDLVSALTR